jgi:hypothetical protein
MKSILMLAVCAASLHAHFTFIVPQAGGQKAELIISETLSVEDAVSAAMAREVKLKMRDAKGEVVELKLEAAGDRFLVTLPGSGKRLVWGRAEMGVRPPMRSGKTHLLLYYPKTVLGMLRGAEATVGEEQVVELVPHGEAGALRMTLLARGKPLANTEFTVIQPDGTQQKVKTDETGTAGPFTQSGRYGAWARYWEDTPGEHGGKPYEQLRHYAMLVVDSYAKPAVATTLPEKTSSFGAALDGDWLYVYGGHIARTHSYSTESVSGRFQRWNLRSGTWEMLAGGPGLQGMNLLAHDGNICRVGGMAPRNKPGEKADTQSVAEVACFGSNGKWRTLPALPEARSSHDVVVIGGQVLVTGGWNLRGAQPSEWAKTTLALDWAKPEAGWRTLPQPFERRALITAVHGGKMYVIGGIMPSGQVSREVDTFDPASGKWAKGPTLPGADINGFAPAAAVHEGRLYVSVGNGSLYRMDEAKGVWMEAGQTTERLAHRMVSVPGGLLIAGGAHKGANFDLVEKVALR